MLGQIQRVCCLARGLVPKHLTTVWVERVQPAGGLIEHDVVRTLELKLRQRGQTFLHLGTRWVTKSDQPMVPRIRRIEESIVRVENDRMCVLQSFNGRLAKR